MLQRETSAHCAKGEPLLFTTSSARSVMAGVFLKRDFYLSIFFARRMKKNKHEFLACARHARLPLQI